MLKCWHVFRHSFISAMASKGIDQRMIDELAGQSTEEQRSRYRRLYPDVKQEAHAAGIRVRLPGAHSSHDSLAGVP